MLQILNTLCPVEASTYGHSLIAYRVSSIQYRYLVEKTTHLIEAKWMKNEA